MSATGLTPPNYSRQSREAEVSKTRGAYSICIVAGFSGGALLLEHAMSKHSLTEPPSRTSFQANASRASRPEPRNRLLRNSVLFCMLSRAVVYALACLSCGNKILVYPCLYLNTLLSIYPLSSLAIYLARKLLLYSTFAKFDLQLKKCNYFEYYFCT